MSPAEDRTGSKPIRPIPTTIPIRQMLNLVTLNDIHYLFLYRNYYNHSQHSLLEIEERSKISATELINHKWIGKIVKFWYIGTLRIPVIILLLHGQLLNIQNQVNLRVQWHAVENWDESKRDLNYNNGCCISISIIPSHNRKLQDFHLLLNRRHSNGNLRYPHGWMGSGIQWFRMSL